jgi:hypothetical protein
VKSNSHTVVEDADMLDQKPVPAVEARLSVLERQVAWWRRATVAALLVLALGGTLAFQQGVPGPVEASSVTLRAARGAAVTLSLRPSGELEARFSGSVQAMPRGQAGSAFVLVDPGGREVLRLGGPSARQLAP